MADFTITQSFYFSHRVERWKAWLQGGPARWIWLQFVYGHLEFLLGLLAFKRSRPYRAADHFCKVSRRVDVETPSRTRARAQLKRFFDQEDVKDTVEDFRRTRYAAALRNRFLPQPFPQNVTFRGNLLPLKAYDPRTGERGVLLLTFNYLFQAFHAVYQTEKMRDYYRVVLEPSYHRFEDVAYTLFTGWDYVIQAGNEVLRTGIEAVGAKVETVPLSSADWTDSDCFAPLPNTAKRFDVIYVANWSRNKAHEVLFRALARMPRSLRVALVGITWERTRQAIEDEAKKYGVSDQCEIFEKVPPEEVNRLLGLSRVNVLLSRHEGGNKALYEAMFANVPSVVYRHCEGLDPTCINSKTGVLVDDDDLAESVLSVLERPERFSPREWALLHTGWQRSTLVLNDKLKTLALSAGEVWNTDIAPKVNRPGTTYKLSEDADRLRSTLQHLSKFLHRDEGVTA